MSISTLGVSAAFLRDFLTRVDPAHTTQDVCDAIIKPETLERKCAYVDLLEGKTDAKGRPLVGKATVFVSHAWAYPFPVPCEVMLDDAKEDESKYFWFDLFVNNQHDTTEKPHDWWSTTFKRSIAAINAVLLVLHPWTDPVPLTRAWCLWEILCTIDQRVPMRVRLPPSERPAFVKALAEDYKVVMEALVRVQAEKATAKSAHDKETIFAAIQSSAGGFVVLNQKVKDQLRAWLLENAQDAVADMERDGETESTEYAQLCLNVGAVMREHGEYDQAIEMYQRSLAIYLKTLGEDDPNTADSYNNMGAAYLHKGEYDRAIEYYQRALAIRLNALGEDHADTAASYNNIGNVYDSKGEYDRAIEYLQRDLAIRLKTLGEDHPRTADTYNNIGTAHYSKGEYDRAIEYYQRSLAIRLKTLGEDHPDSAASYNNIGAVYDDMGEHNRAIEYYQRAVSIGVKALGEGHPHVKDWRHNLAAAQASDSSHPSEAESSKCSMFFCFPCTR